ncbi:hypothetical protein AMR41_10205 [Hapalosiphon sp. MRB220]|nr:hypothetical protein AMR41_10205 [Hapalosiphon sp. MRB220]
MFGTGITFAALVSWTTLSSNTLQIVSFVLNTCKDYDVVVMRDLCKQVETAIPPRDSVNAEEKPRFLRSPSQKPSPSENEQEPNSLPEIKFKRAFNPDYSLKSSLE